MVGAPIPKAGSASMIRCERARRRSLVSVLPSNWSSASASLPRPGTAIQPSPVKMKKGAMSLTIQGGSGVGPSPRNGEDSTAALNQ